MIVEESRDWLDHFAVVAYRDQSGISWHTKCWWRDGQ